MLFEKFIQTDSMLLIINIILDYAVTRAIKDCWLDQSDYVNQSDHVEI